MFFLHKRRFKKLFDEKQAEENFAQVRPELEKGDVPAMIIAAFIAFLPFIIVIAGGLLLFAWIFGR